MSRVFVSCAYRDRAMGQRVIDVVRGMGHEVTDDRGDASAPYWCDEVVRRIEHSDIFVAVASPSYGSAKACRVAADHASARDLRVLRLDLGDGSPENCHPVVLAAESVSFDPDDPGTVRLLGDSLADVPQGGPAPVAAALPAVRTPEPVRLSWVKVTAGVLAALVYVGVFAVLMRHAMATPEYEPSSTPVAQDLPAPTPSAAAATAAVTATAAPDVGMDTSLLSALGTVAERYPDLGLPISSCEVFDLDGAVVCRHPASHIQAVVVRQFPSSEALYSAYAAALADLSAQPVPENSGNCSFDESNGELGWNLDERHTRDHGIDEQIAGGLDPATDSAGRVFCAASGEVMRLVWTQDPDLLVGVTGRPTDRVIGWWRDLHLQLACADGAVGTGCT